RRPLRGGHVSYSQFFRLSQSCRIRRHVQIDVAAQETRELPELPRIVRSPVDDGSGTLVSDQVERFKPDFVMHEHAENDIGLKCPNTIDEPEVEIGEVAIGVTIPGVEQLDLVPQRNERRQEIGVLVALAARGVAIGMAAEDTEDFHGNAFTSSFANELVKAFP